LTLICGPERIESSWWDGEDVQRDYFVAEDRAGLRLWVFRERTGEHRWFLHGIFG
jgi:protein ImuB